MADGLNSDYDIDFLTECIGCETIEACCDESCEGRIWVAPCGTIDYETGEISNEARQLFCEPEAVTAFSYSDNITLREKQYRSCKKFRKAGMPDPSFSLTFDICQSDNATSILLGRCSFDYFIAPKGNNVNWESFPNVFDLRTKVMWGRAIGDNYTWEFPDDDCQSTSRDFLNNGYCWQLGTESEIANAA